MPDTFGVVTIPDPVLGDPFPIAVGYGLTERVEQNIVEHRFGSGDAKVTQRFLVGPIRRRWSISRELRNADRAALEAWWRTLLGPATPFEIDIPAAACDGEATTRTARFAEPELAMEWRRSGFAGVSMELVEHIVGSGSYTSAATVERLPSGSFASGLLAQVQELIPLVTITPLDGAAAARCSDRRVTVDSALFVARLMEIPEVGQTIDADADAVQIRLANADGVIAELVNGCWLQHATVKVEFFHVQANNRLHLWSGYVEQISDVKAPVVTLTCRDGLYELRRGFPNAATRTCWKPYDTAPMCPFAASGALDTANFPGADDAACDHSYDGANGCMAHGMSRWFGGLLIEPEHVRLKQGGQFRLTAASIISDTASGRPVPCIYTDREFRSPCIIAAGRDEDQFYDALGVVSAGPIGAFSSRFAEHRLDQQSAHGPGRLGLREILGADPAGSTDFMSLGQSGNQTGGDFRKVYSGNSTYRVNYAAGVAALELRRTDAKGIQPSLPDSHQMEALVATGIQGGIWSGGSRSTATLTNPMWVALDVLFRGMNRHLASAADQQALFHVAAAEAVAAACDTDVPILVGDTGNENQFSFCGRVGDERRPLIEWLRQIFLGFCGHFVWSGGKLKAGIRTAATAGVVEAFGVGNVILNSLQVLPYRAKFNRLTVRFANAALDWVSDSIVYQDEAHAVRLGGGTHAEWIDASVDLVGCYTRSQAARVATVLAREELGGATLAEIGAKRSIAARSTPLSFVAEPGMVCSITDAAVPGGSARWRLRSWRLNADFSITMAGETFAESVYDLTAGPRAADVNLDELPVFTYNIPAHLAWHPYSAQAISGNPMRATNDRTFSVEYTDTQAADGSAITALVVSGVQPVNAFATAATAPKIRAVATGSGSLPAGAWYAAVCAVNAAGECSPPSNIVAGQLSGTGSMVLGSIRWPVGTWAGWRVYVASSEDMLCEQPTYGGTGTLPSSIAINSAVARSTLGLPSPHTAAVRVESRAVFHAGFNGGEVSAVAENEITVEAFISNSDDWDNCILSVIGRSGNEPLPPWDFLVTAWDGATGTFTVTPDPEAAGVVAGDVVTVRMKPGSISGNVVTMAKFVNVQAPDGLAAGDEVGRVALILAGPGRNQQRRIVDNTATTFEVEAPWDATTDSVVIIIAASIDQVVTAPVANNRQSDTAIRISVPVDNVADGTRLLSAGLLHQSGGATRGQDLAHRDQFLFGSAAAAAPGVGLEYV